MMAEFLRKLGAPLEGGGSRQRGFTILEGLVAAVIVLLIAVMMADGFTMNLDSRAKNERQLKFLQVESALRSATFRRYSDFVESKPNCKTPAIKTLWKTQPVKELRLLPLKAAAAGKQPPPLVERCKDQTGGGGLKNGIYQCFELRPGSGGGKGFLDENEAYAEVFFGLWDVQNDRETSCAAFNDAATPVRGARLYYTIYWRPRGPQQKKDGGKFLNYSGIFYGQTHAKD